MATISKTAQKFCLGGFNLTRTDFSRACTAIVLLYPLMALQVVVIGLHSGVSVTKTCHKRWVIWMSLLTFP